MYMMICFITLAVATAFSTVTTDATFLVAPFSLYSRMKRSFEEMSLPIGKKLGLASHVFLFCLLRNYRETVLICILFQKTINLLYDPRNMANDKKIDKILVHCHWIMKDGVPHFRHHMLGGTHKEQLDCVYRFLFMKVFFGEFGVLS